MRKLASERGKQVANRRGGGGKWVENRKKILNSGNEPKNILKAKELAFSGAKNELVFERKKGQSKRKMGPKIRELLRSFVVPIRSGLLRMTVERACQFPVSNSQLLLSTCRAHQDSAP